MIVLMLCVAFLVLQGTVILASVAFFTRRHRVAYYAALYSPVIAFALAAGRSANDDWLAVMIIQSALSLTYNLYISSSKRAE
jgi:predicted permease